MIVGAPRCGTTSLSRYLEAHPDVCFSRVKEPHFFSQTDYSATSTKDLRRIVQKNYLDRYFAHCSEASLLAEASVTYFYVPERLEPVLRLWPDAKFVIALRNPLQMIPSLHQRLFYNGDEDQRDFARAWHLVPERRRGQSIPARCADPRWLDYWEIGLLGKYLSKFLGTIGEERCHISIFEDLSTDAGAEYRRLLEFLDLPDDGQSHFGRHRPSLSCRIGWLQRLLMRPPRAAVSLLASDYLRERAGARRPPAALAKRLLGLRKRILDWNRVEAPPIRLEAGLVEAMKDTYRSDIQLLSKLTGRDLSFWIDERPTTKELKALRASA